MVLKAGELKYLFYVRDLIRNDLQTVWKNKDLRSEISVSLIENVAYGLMQLHSVGLSH
jgi:hypothetical protein